MCCDAERPGPGTWHLSPPWSVCAHSPSQLPTHAPGPEPTGSTRCTQHPSSPARPLHPRVLTHMSGVPPFLPPISTADTDWTLTGWGYWGTGPQGATARNGAGWSPRRRLLPALFTPRLTAPAGSHAGQAPAPASWVLPPGCRQGWRPPRDARPRAARGCRSCGLPCVPPTSTLP